jgi:hypothetical protein
VVEKMLHWVKLEEQQKLFKKDMAVIMLFTLFK